MMKLLLALLALDVALGTPANSPDKSVQATQSSPAPPTCLATEQLCTFSVGPSYCATCCPTEATWVAGITYCPLTVSRPPLPQEHRPCSYTHTPCHRDATLSPVECTLRPAVDAPHHADGHARHTRPRAPHARHTRPRVRDLRAPIRPILLSIPLAVRRRHVAVQLRRWQPVLRGHLPGDGAQPWPCPCHPQLLAVRAALHLLGWPVVLRVVLPNDGDLGLGPLLLPALLSHRNARVQLRRWQPILRGLLPGDGAQSRPSPYVHRLRPDVHHTRRTGHLRIVLPGRRDLVSGPQLLPAHVSCGHARVPLHHRHSVLRGHLPADGDQPGHARALRVSSPQHAWPSVGDFGRCSERGSETGEWPVPFLVGPRAKHEARPLARAKSGLPR